MLQVYVIWKIRWIGCDGSGPEDVDGGEEEDRSSVLVILLCIYWASLLSFVGSLMILRSRPCFVFVGCLYPKVRVVQNVGDVCERPGKLEEPARLVLDELMFG